MTDLLKTRRVFVFIFALGLFVMAARAVNDPDFWWHLRTGQLILQNHGVFHTDPYSFTRLGRPWVNHEWLSEILIYSVYRTAGWAGLSVTFGAVTAATLFLVFLRSAGRPYVAAIVTLWGAFLSAPTWGTRPHTLSLLLASVFLVILERSSSRPKLLWCTVPLTFLWVNLHGEYALGIGLLILFFLGIALDASFRFDSWPEAKPRLKMLGAAIVACIAVVPLNPAGLEMFSYPFETLRSPAMQSYIDEWFSPSFHDPKHLPLLFMILAIMAVLAISPRRMRPRELLLLLATLAAALHSVRHVGIFVLVAVPILCQLIQSALEHHGKTLRPESATLPPAKLLSNAVVLIVFVVFIVVRVRQVVQQQPETETRNFPAAAVAYIAANHPAGPILNHYNWGGYLIWKLYPEYPVYIDGRADLYGDSFLDDFSSTYYARTDHWQRDLEQWHIRTVLFPPDAPLISILRSQSGWHQLYADKSAVILTRLP